MKKLVSRNNANNELFSKVKLYDTESETDWLCGDSGCANNSCNDRICYDSHCNDINCSDRVCIDNGC